MEAAGLVTRVWAVGSRRVIGLRATEAGKRLTAWIRDRQCTATGTVLGSMHRADARDALVRGLRELAAAAG